MVTEKQLANLRPNRFVKGGTGSQDPSAMGKRGGEVRRKQAEERRKMKETLDILLTKSMKKKGKVLKPEDITSIAEKENINTDVQTAISIAVLRNALNGDVESIKFIRDTIGEKPTDKVEIDESKTIEAWVKSHEVKL